MNTLFETVPVLAPVLEINFTVLGTPRPQGSSRAFIPKGWTRPIITSDNPKLMPWRQQIAGVALNLNLQPFADDVPLEITMNFYFTKPKSAKKRRGMTVKPDGDKLVRAVFDSLKGVLYHDDAQIVELHARKHYGGPERCEIRIQEAL